jgi:hypothetical protein
MFTLVTIFLISIFVFILYSRSSNVVMEEQYASAERTEAVVVNLFTKTLSEDYMNSIMTVASANALRAMLVYVNETRTPLSDPEPEEFFREIVVNGTIEGAYSSTAMSYDLAMQLTAVNDSHEIILASTAKDSTVLFGGTTALTEIVSTIDELQSLHSITINITNSTALSGELYLLVYNASTHDEGRLIALETQQFSWTDFDTHEVTFNLPYTLPLGPDKQYYLVLAAPYAGADGFLADVSAESCDSCSAETWTIDSSGTTALDFPFDFSLPYAVIGEGFLRQLINSFELLGKEKLNIDTHINFTSIDVSGGPWNVEVNATFLISTEKTTVSFSDIYSEGIGEVSIIGMYDPLSILHYEVLSEERQYLRIAEQNVSDDFDDQEMFRHLDEQTFVFNEDAPSYIQRFAGTDASSSTCCGIQTVYTPINLAGGIDNTYSHIDHMFQDSAQCTDISIDPLYYISSGTDDLGFFSGTASPYFDYASIEFYHLDEMATEGTATISPTCPTTT